VIPSPGSLIGFFCFMDNNLVSALEPLGLAGNPNLQTIVSPILGRDLAVSLFHAPEAWSCLSEAKLTSLRGLIVGVLVGSDLPYHNLNHALKVEARAIRLGKAAGLTGSEMNLLRLAALCHDLLHSGSRYRQQKANIECPALSNEEYSVLKADELLASELTIYERLLLQAAILATSFAQKAEVVEDKSLARGYAPSSKLEQLLAFADIGGVETTFAEFVDDSLLIARENNDFNKMKSVQKFQGSAVWFNDYVTSELTLVQPYLPPGTYNHLVDLLKKRRARIEQLLSPNSVECLTYLEAIAVAEMG
jgi:hypothetical protein